MANDHDIHQVQGGVMRSVGIISSSKTCFWMSTALCYLTDMKTKAQRG